jgi:release factor glutamine methyltransferase
MTVSPPVPLQAVLRDARSRIDATEAELLLAHVLDRPRSWLFAHADALLREDEAARFDTLLARRERGEPVAYLTGRRGFWTLDLAVTPDTLVPRAETERLVEAALDRLPAGETCRVADLGTGSGAIALAIARERPTARVVATDRSEAALAVARDNARALGIGNVAFRAGDWYAALGGERFDLIVSNPPYIAAGDPHLDRGDLRFEPRAALTPGGDGLAAIRTLVAGAPAHLVEGGWLMVEHGHDQGPAVRALFDAAGFADVATLQDLECRDRIGSGRRGHRPSG